MIDPYNGEVTLDLERLRVRQLKQLVVATAWSIHFSTDSHFGQEWFDAVHALQRVEDVRGVLAHVSSELKEYVDEAEEHGDDLLVRGLCGPVTLMMRVIARELDGTAQEASAEQDSFLSAPTEAQ